MDEAYPADDARPRPRLLARRRHGELPHHRVALQPQAGRRQVLHPARSQEAAGHHSRADDTVR